jgi:ribosomal protein S18 acetylase RimI-like enzyme
MPTRMPPTDSTSGQDAGSTQATVVPFRDAYRADFDRLNRAWIEQHFALEGEDEALLRDPYGTIVARGGEVLFVIVADVVVGTCAIKPEGPPATHRYELCKMAVDPAARGRGYADLLIRAALDAARARGAHEIVLRTNTVLAAAVRLYEKHGFRPTRTGPGIGAEYGYTRGNLEMMLTLAPSGVHVSAPVSRQPTRPVR